MRRWAIIALLLGTLGLVAAEPLVFRDVTEETGLAKPLAGIRGHAAAWGDVDGDGRPDLWVGTFHTAGKPGQLFLNRKGGFVLDKQENLRVSACASGAVFADLNNTGRLDLYVSNNANGKSGVRATPSKLFRNDGKGKFTDISASSKTCPAGFLGRSVAASDIDGDGLLDLIACEFYYTPKAKTGLALYRNKGKWVFEDVAKSSGLPTGSAVPGVAIADVNEDGWPDVFVTAADGKNRLYLNDGKGKFTACPGNEVFAWKGLAKDDPLAGVCIADVNGDGLPDIVVGHHPKAPWKKPLSIRLYLHRGLKKGIPSFEDVTDSCGLTPLGMKAPHVEIQDVDNDGRPDIVTGIVKFKDGKPYPVIYRNLGVQKGKLRFEETAWKVNDFPNKDDLAQKRTGDFYKKMMKDRKVVYAAAAPMCDYDGDGRMDLLLVTWWEETTPLLLRNETKSGNWLQVQVAGKGKLNRQGIGAKVRVYEAGKKELLGVREISVSLGWCSGQEAAVHFGLGKVKDVDVEVVLPHGGGSVWKRGVKANQRLAVEAKR